MKRIRTKFFRNYKFNSVFIRTFLVLILLTLMIMIVFYLLTNRLISNNFSEKTKATNLSLLTKTSDSLDLSFSYLSKTMTNLMRDKHVSGIMVAPDLDDYNRNADAARMIYNVPANNELVGRAFLYIPYNNTVVTSNRTIEDKQKFYDKNLIDNYLKDSSGMDSITVDGFTTKIKVERERILLFQNYPASLPIATLVFELKPEKLYEIIQGSGSFDKHSIFVYDGAGRAIFPQLIFYPTEETLNNNTDMMYSYQSGKSNWKFILLTDRNNLKLDSRAALTLILPSMLLLLIISLGLSSYIIYSIYTPITDLMNSINNPDGIKNSQYKNNSAKNEFDFFKLAYANAVNKSEQLAHLMESVSPAVLQKFFTNLLYGKVTDEKYIKSTLESLRNPFDIHNHYVVLISRQVYHEGIIPTAMETKLYNLSMSKIIYSLLEDKCLCYSMETEDDSQVYILHFDVSVSVMQIKSAIFNLCKELNERVAHLPYNVVIGRGKVYNGIADIQYSYMDAQKDLNYRKYYEKEHPDMLKGNISDESPEISGILYYKECTNNMLQSVADGNNGASAKFFSFINDISKTAMEISAARQIYEAIMEAVIEKMISMRISEDEMTFKEKKYGDKEFNSLTSVQEMEQFALMFSQQAIELIDIYGKKSRHKYIERTKEYIANNYSESTLSLNMVSVNIGVNAYYLSHLFNENLNQRFVDYLNLYRVGKAKQLLAATNLTIADVGYKTGFNSSQNFIRVFKKYTGSTPGQYREKEIK